MVRIIKGLECHLAWHGNWFEYTNGCRLCAGLLNSSFFADIGYRFFFLLRYIAPPNFRLLSPETTLCVMSIKIKCDLITITLMLLVRLGSFSMSIILCRYLARAVPCQSAAISKIRRELKLSRRLCGQVESLYVRLKVPITLTRAATIQSLGIERSLSNSLHQWQWRNNQGFLIL